MWNFENIPSPTKLREFGSQVKEFSCPRHNEPLDVICTAKNCSNLLNCCKCCINHNRKHQKDIKKIPTFLKSLSAPSNLLDTESKNLLNANSKNYLETILPKAKEKLKSICDRILAKFEEILTRKKKMYLIQARETASDHKKKINVKSYNEKVKNFSDDIDLEWSSNGLSELIAQTNECESITQFEQLLLSLQKKSEVKSEKLKEEVVEIERVAQSLLSQVKVNPSNIFETLYNNLEKTVLPTVNNFFEEAVIYIDNAGNNIVPPKQPKPPSKYYYQLNRARCKAKNPNCDPKEITKNLQKEWENMSNSERLDYVNMADKDRKNYQEELKEFTALGGSLPTKKFKSMKKEEENDSPCGDEEVEEESEEEPDEKSEHQRPVQRGVKSVSTFRQPERKVNCKRDLQQLLKGIGH